jgi:hypothetical protein
MGLILLIPFGLFVAVVIAFLWAGVMDLIDSRRRKKDVFYQLSRNHNRRRRPAAK